MKKRRFTLITLIVLFLLFLPTLLADSDIYEEIQNFYNKTLIVTLNELSNKKNWDDAYFVKNSEKAEKILKVLELSKNYNNDEIIYILIEKISYDPFELSHKTVRIEMRMPVIFTLAKIGLKPINALIDKLVKIDPTKKQFEDLKSVEEFKNYYKNQELYPNLISTIIEIYNCGGYGEEMAKKRLFLESDKLSGKEKENILKVIFYYFDK